MRCAEAVERMMTVDPAALEGGTDTPLNRHLRSCGRCSAIAATLRRELHALDLGLATAGAATEETWRAPADVERGAESARTDRPRGPAHGAGRLRPTAPTRWRRTAWLPLAAAAGVAAALVLTWPGGEPAPPADGARAARAADGRALPRVVVRPPADHTALVMETGNPKITIVWLYEREGS